MDWLMRWCFARSRQSALVLLDQLLQMAHLQPIITNSLSFQSGIKHQHVIDELNAYYRFVCIF